MKLLPLIFGLLCYCLFAVVFCYTIGFVGDVFVPKSVSIGDGPWSQQPLVINSLLILLWGIQHSVMARRGFKTWLCKWLPEYLERPLYVLSSSLILILLMLCWQPQPQVIWSVVNPVGWWLLWCSFAGGWLLALYSTFLTSHADLFGLRQTLLMHRGADYVAVPFTERSLYRWVRHPMMIGLLIAFWATPQMTVSHLVFSIGMTVYTLIGIYFEEASLAARLGEPYRHYQSRTNKIIPKIY